MAGLPTSARLAANVAQCFVVLQLSMHHIAVVEGCHVAGLEKLTGDDRALISADGYHAEIFWTIAGRVEGELPNTPTNSTAWLPRCPGTAATKPYPMHTAVVGDNIFVVGVEDSGSAWPMDGARIESVVLVSRDLGRGWACAAGDGLPRVSPDTTVFAVVTGARPRPSGGGGNGFDDDDSGLPPIDASDVLGRRGGGRQQPATTDDEPALIGGGQASDSAHAAAGRGYGQPSSAPNPNASSCGGGAADDRGNGTHTNSTNSTSNATTPGVDDPGPPIFGGIFDAGGEDPPLAYPCSLLCVLGGSSVEGGSGNVVLSNLVHCSADQGATWSPHEALPLRIAGAGVSQFGAAGTDIFIVGGVRNDTTDAVIQGRINSTTCTLGDWVVQGRGQGQDEIFTPPPPWGRRAFMAAAYSSSQSALFVAGGYKQSSAWGQPLPFSPESDAWYTQDPTNPAYWQKIDAEAGGGGGYTRGTRGGRPTTMMELPGQLPLLPDATLQLPQLYPQGKPVMTIFDGCYANFGAGLIVTLEYWRKFGHATALGVHRPYASNNRDEGPGCNSVTLMADPGNGEPLAFGWSLPDDPAAADGPILYKGFFRPPHYNCNPAHGEADGAHYDVGPWASPDDSRCAPCKVCGDGNYSRTHCGDVTVESHGWVDTVCARCSPECEPGFVESQGCEDGLDRTCEEWIDVIYPPLPKAKTDPQPLQRAILDSAPTRTGLGIGAVTWCVSLVVCTIFARAVTMSEGTTRGPSQSTGSSAAAAAAQSSSKASLHQAVATVLQPHLALLAFGLRVFVGASCWQWTDVAASSYARVVLAALQFVVVPLAIVLRVHRASDAGGFSVTSSQKLQLLIFAAVATPGPWFGYVVSTARSIAASSSSASPTSKPQSPAANNDGSLLITGLVWLAAVCSLSFNVLQCGISINALSALHASLDVQDRLLMGAVAAVDAMCVMAVCALIVRLIKRHGHGLLSSSYSGRPLAAAAMTEEESRVQGQASLTTVNPAAGTGDDGAARARMAASHGAIPLQGASSAATTPHRPAGSYPHLQIQLARPQHVDVDGRGDRIKQLLSQSPQPASPHVAAGTGRAADSRSPDNRHSYHASGAGARRDAACNDDDGEGDNDDDDDDGGSNDGVSGTDGHSDTLDLPSPAPEPAAAASRQQHHSRAAHRHDIGDDHNFGTSFHGLLHR